MNESHNLIENVNKKLDKFSDSLEGANYVVGLIVKEIQIIQHQRLSIDNLRDLFPGENISGTIDISSFQNFDKKIIDVLSFTSFKGGFVGRTKDYDIVLFRKKTFYSLLEEAISLPPDIVYRHDAERGSYFGDGIMWDFCYILLKGNRGIVIAGAAYD